LATNSIFSFLEIILAFLNSNKLVDNSAPTLPVTIQTPDGQILSRCTKWHHWPQVPKWGTKVTRDLYPTAGNWCTSHVAYLRVIKPLITRQMEC